MSKYGQYCPIARSLEILGDRWTLLIIRELLTGTTHFNDLERGLPGISRALLASRLRLLQKSGVVEKRLMESGRQTTAYQLTQAGQELLPVMFAIRSWGEAWAFTDPTPDELDPVLLMWWLRSRVDRNQLPEHRIVAQFDFLIKRKASFWLILGREDVTLCLTDPGYEVGVLVTSDLTAFYKLFAGRLTYQAALNMQGVRVEGQPQFTRAFPQWFGFGGEVALPPLPMAQSRPVAIPVNAG